MRALVLPTLFLLHTLLCGFTFFHEGRASGRWDGEPVEGRAVFLSSVSSQPGGVVLRLSLPLPDGATAFLTADLDTLGPQSPETVLWSYYEATAPGVVRFRAREVRGTIRLLDFAQRGGEVAATVALDAAFDGEGMERELTGGRISTTPSPEVLRSAPPRPALSAAGGRAARSTFEEETVTGCARAYDDLYGDEAAVLVSESPPSDCTGEPATRDSGDSAGASSCAGDTEEEDTVSCADDAEAAAPLGHRPRRHRVSLAWALSGRIIHNSPFLLLLLLILWRRERGCLPS